MKMYCIYCYTNKINGKKYVGKTSQSLTRRAREGQGYSKCRRFYEDIQKYGWSNFEGEVIEDKLTPKEADEKEHYWVEKLDTIFPKGYNLQSGSNHCTLHTETTTLIGERQKGHMASEETRNKMSESSPRRRAVLQFTTDGQLVSEYQMLRDATKETGISWSKISLVCSGKRKKAGGYIWRYKEVG